MSLKAIAEDGALVPAPRNLPTQLFETFDRADDEQIIAELQGGVIEEYAYQFKSGDQTVTGLSLAGVMAVAQNMGGITCGQPVWVITDDEITCDISATDHGRGLTVWGTATEMREMQTRNGPKPDKFARAKALSKAQRNAIRKVIPETVATRMLKQYLSGKRPEARRPIAQPPRQNAPQLAPPVEVYEDTPDGPQRVDNRRYGQAADADEPITERQTRAIFGIGRGRGMDPDAVKSWVTEQFSGKTIDDLTMAEASVIIANWQGNE